MENGTQAERPKCSPSERAFNVRRSAFGVRWVWRLGGCLFFGFVCMSMAQEENPAAQPVEVYTPISPGITKFDGANPPISPTPGVDPNPGNNTISANEPGGTGGANQIAQPTSGPSSIGLTPSNSTPSNSNISTGNLGTSNGPNQMTSFPSGLDTGSGTAPELPAPNREASDKKWLLLYNFSTGVTYDDNIFITNQNRVADEIFTVSGGLTLGLGDFRNLQDNYLLAQYQLTGFFYVHNSQEDAPQQQFALRTQFRFSKLTLQTQTLYDYLTQANRQVGNFVRQTVIDNSLRLNYDYSDKTQFFLGGEQITNLFASFLNSYEYIGRLGGTYQISPKINLGGEAVFGRLVQEQSATGTYAQLRLLADYDLTGKLSAQLSVGGEIRYYDSSGGDLTKATPVFSLGLTYRPFPDTSIGLRAYRNVNASPSLAGENYTATGIALQLRQLLFQRLTVGISTGYENDSYLATQAGAAEPNRTDNYYFIEPNFTYRFRDWLSATLSYEFRRNASNEASSAFFDNRITFSVGVNF
jgi:hypothetical protein